MEMLVSRRQIDLLRAVALIGWETAIRSGKEEAVICDILAMNPNGPYPLTDRALLNAFDRELYTLVPNMNGVRNGKQFVWEGRKEPMRKLILLLVAFTASVELLGAQGLPKRNPYREALKNRASHVVLRAVTKTVVVSNWKRTSRKVLTPKEAHRIIIVKVGQLYYWASRDNQELIYNKSGLFHNFTDTQTGALIKVFDPRGLSDSSLSFLLNLGFAESGSGVQVFESISFGLKTFTWWGTAFEFNP